MPSGGKGGPSGSTTTQTINPVSQAQLPFLTGGAIGSTGLPGAVGWNQALNLAIGNPFQYYPGQTLASPNYWLPTGYNELAASGANANSLLPYGNNLFTDIAGGSNSIYNSPAFGGLADLASGTNAYLQENAANVTGLSALGNQAGANPYANMLGQLQVEAAYQPNAGMNELQNTASGAYLNSNPYLDQMFGAASDAVARAYQNATAPQTASNFSGAGRYGSGAYANSVSQNQQDLATQLGHLSANIYGGNYQAERARQDAAGQALGALIQQNYGLQGNLLNMGGNQYLQGLGQAAQDYANSGQLALGNVGAMQNALNTLQSGYQSGNANELQALALFPSLMSAQYGPAQAMIQAGQGLTGLDQAQIQDAMNRFYGNIAAPWQTNEMYLNQIGQPTSGSSSVSQPYFTNPLANIMGAGLGGLSLYNGLKGSGLFGGLGGAGMGIDNLAGAAALPGFDTLGGTVGMGALGGDFGGAGAGKGIGTALPFVGK